MNTIIEYGLIFLIIFTPLAFGSVHVWAYTIVEVVVLLLLLIWLLKHFTFHDSRFTSSLFTFHFSRIHPYFHISLFTFYDPLFPLPGPDPFPDGSNTCDSNKTPVPQYL